MWVVDKSLPRPNGHQDGYWSFQEASACALLCRFQIGPGQIGKCDMYGKHGKTDFISGGWNMMKLWFSDLWLDMPHWWLLNFENMSTNLAISRARSICWDELEPPSGSVFLVAVCVGIACRVAGHRSLSGQLATEGESMIMYKYDLLMDRDNRRWFWKQNTQLKLP